MHSSRLNGIPRWQEATPLGGRVAVLMRGTAAVRQRGIRCLHSMGVEEYMSILNYKNLLLFKKESCPLEIYFL